MYSCSSVYSWRPCSSVFDFWSGVDNTYFFVFEFSVTHHQSDNVYYQISIIIDIYVCTKWFRKHVSHCKLMAYFSDLLWPGIGLIFLYDLRNHAVSFLYMPIPVLRARWVLCDPSKRTPRGSKCENPVVLLFDFWSGVEILKCRAWMRCFSTRAFKRHNKPIKIKSTMHPKTSINKQINRAWVVRTIIVTGTLNTL